MPETRDRILDGALKAIAKRGLSDLAMRDVGAESGVARGTVYRHFANREALLAELVQREAGRFLRRWQTALAGVPAGSERVRAAVEYPARFIADHPVLARLSESDPDYMLRAIRQHYPAIRATLEELLGPVLGEMAIVKQDVLPRDQVVEFVVRIMLSMILIPSEDPSRLARTASAVHRSQLAGQDAAA